MGFGQQPVKVQMEKISGRAEKRALSEGEMGQQATRHWGEERTVYYYQKYNLHYNLLRSE
jgi:hypothetical protein